MKNIIKTWIFCLCTSCLIACTEESNSSGDCDPIKEIYQSYTNTCACNTTGNWLGTSPNCYCDTESGNYELSQDGKTCSRKSTCPDGNCGQCTPGNTSCANGNVQTCQPNGTWGNAIACSSSTQCTTGSCGQCTPGSTSCANGNVQTCQSNGSWGNAIACSSSTQCTTGNCGQCTPGSNSCDNAKVKACLNNGMWGAESYCTSSTTCTIGRCSSTCDSVFFNSQCVYKGDTVTFGKYPQSTSTAEGIEWIVLDIDTSKKQILLLSKYVLDAKPYHVLWDSITWENCTLRTWLNDTFKTTAFNSSEQKQIALTTLQNHNNPDYGTYGGNDTNDSVFLLSLEDARNTDYFANNDARKALATKYAVDNGAYVPNLLSVTTCTNDLCIVYWWLRSPGGSTWRAATVDYIGKVYSDGDYVYGTNPAFGVRPALWVNY